MHHYVDAAQPFEHRLRDGFASLGGRYVGGNIVHAGLRQTVRGAGGRHDSHACRTKGFDNCSANPLGPAGDQRTPSVDAKIKAHGLISSDSIWPPDRPKI